MANWSLPSTASTYVNYTAELDARLDDLAYGLDPALTTVSNVPTNAQRWTSAASKWEKFNGTAWIDLASTYSINVATANALATGRTVSLTGDVTATSAAWTGSTNLSIATTLPTVNSSTGSFGSTSAIPIITVNGKGLVTAVSTAALGTMAAQGAGAVAITGGSIAGTSLTLVQSTTAAPTAEGRMEWDSDDDVLRIGTGAGTKTLVNTDNTQTLTNKTLGSGAIWNGTAIAVAYGGTGATDAATARTNLGIASMGAQAANAVAITGGTIAGTAITLVQSTTAAPTAEGRIEWDTDDDVIVLGTATGSKIQVNTDSAQTLSNKTFGTVVYLAAAGFMFNDDGAKDTGMSWASDGVMNVRCNAATVGTFTTAGWTGNSATATTATRLAASVNINGTPFDGSTAITVTANTSNALTFNDGGAGVASGTTFNGSAARTISYNSVGAPGATGAGASGTWSINISGTAAVASSVVTASTITSTARVGMSVVSSSNDSMYELVKPTVVGYALALTSDNRLAMVQTNGAGDWFKTLLSVDTNGNTTTAGTLNVVGNVTASGNVTAYSDETLKANWRDLDTDFVSQLANVKMGIYDRIDTGVTQVGVSAQSLKSVMTNAVQEDEKGVLSVAYGNAALAACVALAREVTTLKARLAALEV